MATGIRAERVKAVRHGEEVKTAKEIRREQAERDKLFADIADAYFEMKSSSLKGHCDRPQPFRLCHGLRHHFAETLPNSGQFTLGIITEMLTHKNAEFTKKKYGQFLPKSMTAAGNTAAKILAMGGLEKRE